MQRRMENPRTFNRRRAMMLCAGGMLAPGLAAAEMRQSLLQPSGTPLIDLDGSSGDGGFLAQRAPLDSPPRARRKRAERLDDVARLTLAMRNLNTGERILAHPVTATGLDADEMARLSHFMRDWRLNESRAVSANIIVALLQIQMAARQAGFSDEIQLNSGYRTRQTNDLLRERGMRAARNSFHLLARAADFVLPGVPVADTIALAKDFNIGGVGGYSRFVHIDDGPPRTWGTA
jgi:uncharacterized protein YcbK (DUF882 family)